MEWLIVFALGVAELWAAAPAGMVFKFNPLLVFLVASAGAVSGAVVILILGEKVRRWIRNRYPPPEEKPDKLIFRIWKRWGVMGWGIFAPLLVGSPLGAAFGMLLGARVRHLMIWLSVGSILWSAVFSILTQFGVRLFSG